MKYWWLPLLFTAIQPATASIYANLETREVIGVKDGKPLVVISDGKDIVETASPKAEIPFGTRDLKEDQKLKVPMNEAGSSTTQVSSSGYELLKALTRSA